MPSVMKSVETWVEVEVEIELKDFEDDALIEELCDRGYALPDDLVADRRNSVDAAESRAAAYRAWRDSREAA